MSSRLRLEEQLRGLLMAARWRSRYALPWCESPGPMAMPAADPPQQFAALPAAQPPAAEAADPAVKANVEEILRRVREAKDREDRKIASLRSQFQLRRCLTEWRFRGRRAGGGEEGRGGGWRHAPFSVDTSQRGKGKDAGKTGGAEKKTQRRYGEKK